MFRRVLPLVLLAVWSPMALAFPPCPIEPVDLDPFGPEGAEGGVSTTAPWFRGYYALVGDPAIVAAIAPAHREPKSGKCRDRDSLPVPADHWHSGNVGLSPSYAPRSGFGIVALPDIGTLHHDLKLVYTLEFHVDNDPLASAGDWFDVAELRFHWQAETTKPGDEVSAVYRVRKRQGKGGMPMIEIIEARPGQYSIGLQPPAPVQRLVATLPMDVGKPNTRVLLRWGQVRTFAGDQEFGLPPPEGGSGFEFDTALTPSSVDAWLDVVDPQDRTVDSIALPDQWASELAMGLLNYSTEKSDAYAQRGGFVLAGMRISAIAH